MTAISSFLGLLYLLMLIPLDWGFKGHQVVGAIASQHLTPKAQQAVAQLLDGASLESVAGFADQIKSEPRYKSYSPWHYVNIPFGTAYAEAEKNPKGDVVMAIEHCIKKLKDDKVAKEDRAFFLKLLVHFVGDVHQPLHVGRKEDRGGNGIRLRWRGKSTNLHRLWDTQLLEDYQDFNALMDQLPIPTGVQVRDIASQTLAQWVAETHALAYEVYDNAPPNSNLSSVYQKENLPLVYQQLQKAGLRLAATLNTIFK